MIDTSRFSDRFQGLSADTQSQLISKVEERLSKISQRAEAGQVRWADHYDKLRTELQSSMQTAVDSIDAVSGTNSAAETVLNSLDQAQLTGLINDALSKGLEELDSLEQAALDKANTRWDDAKNRTESLLATMKAISQGTV